LARGSLAEIVKIGRQAQVAALMNGQLRLQRDNVRGGNGIAPASPADSVSTRENSKQSPPTDDKKWRALAK
jgi:hypothetical protein